MAKYNIPKLSRNKYGVVKNADINNYITQSQLMMSAGGGSIGGTSSIQVQQQINDTLADRGYVSYTYLKTINGYSLVGQGDIEVTGSGTVDLSNYVTYSYLDSKDYATEAYVASYVSTYAPTADLSAYVTHTELDNAGYTTVVQTTYDNYKNMSYAEKTNGYLYIVSDYNDTAYYITDEDLAYASYATTAYVESVKTSCYNYTDSKMSYSDVVDLINNMIDAMKQNGDLVDAAYVMSKVNGG